MPEDFLSSKLYLKLFPLQQLSAELTAKAARLWKTNGLPSRNPNGPIQVVSIGFGMGARDVAVLMGLATAMAKAPSGKKTFPPIHVLAIDPAATKPGIADNRSFLIAAGFVKAQQSAPSPEIWVKKELEDQAEIRIEIVGSTAEAWIDTHRSGPSLKWDVVLACAVLHLLVDWKSTLDFFLRGLKPEGVFVFAEASGTVGAFEGDFRNGVDKHDRWVKLWHVVAQVREDLLLPAARLVSPGDMSFLCAVLQRLAYQELKGDKAHHLSIRVDSDQETTVAEILELIRTVEGGSDASTLGALRIRDFERASSFVARVKDVLLGDFRLDERLHFKTGTKIHAYSKPSILPRDAVEPTFAAVVAEFAQHRSQIEVSELKASVKESLSKNRLGSVYGRDDATPVRSEQAIAALLYDMRETLALSRDTLMVIARRSGGRYTEAFQLPPISLIGSAPTESAEKYIASMTVYTAAPLANMDKHMSQLLADIEDIGDITLRVDICPESEANRHKVPMELNVSYATNGTPCFVRLTVSEALVRQSKAASRGNRLFGETTAAKYAKSYDGCMADGRISRFYIRPDIDRLRRALKAQSESEQSAMEQSVESIVADNALEKLVTKQVVAAFSSLSDKCRSALVKILVSSLRLAWVEWRRDEDDSPPWRTCYYFVRKNAHRVESRLGVGLLLLLQDADHRAWDSDRNTTTPASPSRVPPLLAAAEPFLAAIQEIRVTELAATTAIHDFSLTLGHELSKIYAGAIDARKVRCKHRTDAECEFASHVTDAALWYGMLWASSKGMTSKDLMPEGAYPFDDAFTGTSWDIYADAIALAAWQVFLGSYIVYQDADSILNGGKAQDINNLWSANLRPVLRIEPQGRRLQWSRAWLVENERGRFTVALFRWFVAGMVNTWKHSVFPKGVFSDYKAEQRIIMAKEFLCRRAGEMPPIELSASIEEEKTVLRVTNPYPGKGLPLRGSGTQLALDLATEEVGAALTGRDAVNCQFYPDKRQHRWFTVLTLPGVMMQERI